MALWKDPVKQSPSALPEFLNPARTDAPALAEAKLDPVTPATPIARAPVRDRARAESLIAPDITIEGKIEGSGHVRIAGRFKGDVNVQGDLSIESGAQVTGSVRADKVLIAGELIGNIDAASHVELMQSGALTGDLKAASLTVAAGSRMRGHAEFGWDDAKAESTKKLTDRSGTDRSSTDRNGADRNGIDRSIGT
jgi:cytoskeletal protein CcmA (bactofilin family)